MYIKLPIQFGSSLRLDKCTKNMVLKMNCASCSFFPCSLNGYKIFFFELGTESNFKFLAIVNINNKVCLQARLIKQSV